MAYIPLQAHYSRSTPTGLQVGDLGVTVQLEAGDTVRMPIPFLPITEEIGVAPVLAHDTGDGATVRMDVSRWQPICLRDGEAACLPIETSQADAVRIARAFEADPTTSWSDSPTAIEAWHHTYTAASA